MKEPVDLGTFLVHNYIQPLGLTEAEVAAELEVGGQEFLDILYGKREIDLREANVLGYLLSVDPLLLLTVQANRIRFLEGVKITKSNGITIRTKIRQDNDE